MVFCSSIWHNLFYWTKTDAWHTYRDRLVATDTLTSKFCDLHFVRLQGINRAGMRTNLQGSWATVGVLTEKGQPKLSAAGKNFMVWKLSSLDGALVSVFLFGGSYTEHWKESAGAVFAVFNAKVRLDERSKEMCLSVFKGDQMLKLGTSADYAVCKGKRKDGTSCTVVVNKKQQGEFCQYHLGTAYQKHRTHRAELNGGNLATAFSGPGTKRAQAVRPNVFSPTKETKFMRPLKHLTSPDLRKVLRYTCSCGLNRTQHSRTGEEHDLFDFVSIRSRDH
jgi:minichromosome maintenance protein 10